MARTLRVPVPKTRDPFINTPLVRAGRDAAGHERFWISTWNHLVGCIGALVSETGAARIFHFAAPQQEPGFYSAVAEDNDTLWLCGMLDHVVRLDLRTGKYQAYPTGAPNALVFQGMIMDRATGKLFALAYPGDKPTAFSFDYRQRKPVTVHRLECEEKYARFSFLNGDGSWSMVLQIPGETFLRWDPRRETVACGQPFTKALACEDVAHGTTYHLIDDGKGCWYVPKRGWYAAKSGRFVKDGPRPEKEMTWFARRGTLAWGANSENAVCEMGQWDMATGKVRHLCTVQDSCLHNFNLTASGKLVAVSIYGYFSRFDGQAGTLELTRRLDADSWCANDCVRRIDRDRLLGTPFITQRFWTVNLRTRKGEDCGRAAPGAGEILQTWNLNGKIYMAAYTGSELMEFDPNQAARFPENPHVVADPPEAMRPIAAADDGRCLFYASSAEYGRLGSVVTRYDTHTGATLYKPHPLPDQRIHCLGYDSTLNRLVAGSAIDADCGSATPKAERGIFAVFDPETLEVLQQAPAPAGVRSAVVLGQVAPGKWLCACHGRRDGVPSFILDLRAFKVPALAEMRQLPPGFRRLLATGRPGLFVAQTDKHAIELWDWRGKEPQHAKTLARNFRGYRVEADRDSVYLFYPKSLTVLDGYLK